MGYIHIENLYKYPDIFMFEALFSTDSLKQASVNKIGRKWIDTFADFRTIRRSGTSSQEKRENERR